MRERMKYMASGVIAGMALASCAATAEGYQLPLSFILLAGGAGIGALGGYGWYKMDKSDKYI